MTRPSKTRCTTFRFWLVGPLSHMQRHVLPGSGTPSGMAPPFKDWDLPPAIRRAQRKLGKVPKGDRQMVQILGMIPIDGLDAVDAACAEALSERVPAASAVINILDRHREPSPPLTIDTPAASRWKRAFGTTRLTCEPVADCKRYDSLRRPNHGKITGAGRVTP